MNIMKLITALFLGLAMFANAQTMTTDPMGKGKLAAFVGANGLFIRDYTTGSVPFAQGWYGLSDKVDVFAGVSEITLLGQEQTSVGVGANVLLTKNKHFSVLSFNSISTPFNRRADACQALWFTSLVASKNITIKKKTLAIYAGYSATVPLGHIADKLFTPPTWVGNVPVGIFTSKGPWGIFGEYNFGRSQHLVGMGVTYIFNP